MTHGSRPKKMLGGLFKSHSEPAPLFILDYVRVAKILLVIVVLSILWYLFYHHQTSTSRIDAEIDKKDRSSASASASESDAEEVKDPNQPVYKSDHPYLPTLQKHKTEDRMFPYRLLCDENRNLIPVVALAAFFRTDFDRERFVDYQANGIKIIGITAYKTFPKPVSDESGDQETYTNDTFDYTQEIENWMSCFTKHSDYGLGEQNNIVDISESDFYDVVDEATINKEEKKYDFIYSCLRDVDDDNSPDPCPMNGWNAINRNYNLALACLPIMIKEFNCKILIIGRVNCGLEHLYGDNLEVVDMLPYHEFQQKIRQSRFLFVPNIYDASPRVVTEAMINNVPVLMNRSIVCGSKYINEETGMFFTDQNDIRYSLKKMLNKEFSPRSWWAENYNVKKMGKAFRQFLAECYPDEMAKVKEVYFA